MELVKKEFTSINTLELTVGTNTPKGGNHSHGGYTIFKLKDLQETDWDIEVNVDEDGHKELVVYLYGDCEPDPFVKALKYAAKILEKQMKENEIKFKKQLGE